jgi:hypothetical protein
MKKLLIPSLLCAALVAAHVDTADAQKTVKRYYIRKNYKDGTIRPFKSRKPINKPSTAYRGSGVAAAPSSPQAAQNRTVPASGNWNATPTPNRVYTQPNPVVANKSTHYYNKFTKTMVPHGYSFNPKINKYVWVGKGSDPRTIKR